MKSNLKVKFLSYMTGRKKGEGFTLIELLVVIIIIGILSAIALPSFLNQANKAKQSEAKQYVSSLMKGQQAYYTENSEFILAKGDVGKLGVGINVQTKEYAYDFAEEAAGGVGADSLTGVAVTASVTGTSPLKEYGGHVSALQVPTGGVTEVVTYTALCEALTAGEAGDVTVATIAADGTATCSDGGTPLGGEAAAP